MTEERKHHELVGQLKSGLETSQHILMREKNENQQGAGLLSSQGCKLMGDKPPQEQTHEEWLEGYDAALEGHDTRTRAPISVLNSRQTESENPGIAGLNQGIPADIPHGNVLTGEFRYRYHKTTPSGRLVLEFEHVKTRTTVAKFFNVRIESQRTGKKYRTGKGGQFTYSEGHKIHRFLTDMLGAPPSRPCRAHHELHRLKHLSLVGEAIFKNAEGAGYWKLTSLRKKK